MKLKEYRLRKGMTQQAVAQHLGIPKKTYQNYEREVREADTALLCALADLYETTLDELVGRESDSAGASIEAARQMQNELVGIFQSLDEEGRLLLLAVAHDIEMFHG